MSALDVVLYGATGYTGRLIARELDARGLSFSVAGRDASRLAALSAALPSKPEAHAVAVDDAAGLRALAARGRVLLSAAGPYARLGPPLLRAALAARVPFADVSGEQGYLRFAAGEDARARAAGVPVVNAVGFDVVPSDLACVLAARDVEEPALDVGIASRAGTSAGTRRSAAASAGANWWYDEGRFRWGPAGRFARSFRFPEPLGERDAVFIPWGDVVTAPRSTGARRVRTFFALPSRLRSTLRAAGWAVDLAGRLPPVRRRAERRASAGPAGPSDGERAAATFAIVAEATGRRGARGRAVVTGRDPYGLTAASAAETAARLLRGGVPPGVHTPSQAFDLEDFAGALRRFDLAFRREA